MSNNPDTNPASQEESFGLNPDLVHFLTEAIEAGDTARIKDLVKQTHAADIADFINQISPEQREVLIEIIGDKFDPEVLPELEQEVKDEVITQLGTEKSAEALAQLDSEEAVQVIEDLEEDEQQEILEAIPEEQRADVEEGLAYPEESAGRLMSKQFVTVRKSWTVGQTIDFLRDEEAELPNDFYIIFVVDKESHPIGWVLVSRVIRSQRDITIKSLMEDEVRTVHTDTDQEEVAYMFHKYALTSVPVVDDDGTIVGVIEVDDVVEVIEEEVEEDIMRLGGIAKETDLYSAFMQTAKRRFPWLFVNLITAIAASAVIALFEGTIQQLVALAVLMPIVASMAGNAGTQTLTIAVRALATKELTSTNARRVIVKEISAAFVNGILFAAIVGAVAFWYYDNLQLSFVLAAATIAALVIAGFAGAIIPLALARVGVDPAIASGVFLTTVTDVTAFFIFLGLAAAWLM